MVFLKFGNGSVDLYPIGFGLGTVTLAHDHFQVLEHNLLQRGSWFWLWPPVAGLTVGGIFSLKLF